MVHRLRCHPQRKLTPRQQDPPNAEQPLLPLNLLRQIQLKRLDQGNLQQKLHCSVRYPLELPDDERGGGS